jgi:hypothetical protein
LGVEFDVFYKYTYDILQSVSNMDTSKLILKINEDYIYEKFPKQKSSPYSISVKKLLPLTENIYSIDLVIKFDISINLLL